MNFELKEHKRGINYLSIGNSFTDTRNVYDIKMQKIGMILFIKGGKPVYNGFKHIVSRYTDGFKFEPESGVKIQCKDYQNIAKYVYGLNEKYKEMKKNNNNQEKTNEN